MNNNPTQVPTWDEFLRPLLELAMEAPIMRRHATPFIADKYGFSEAIRDSRVKSGQTKIENRTGWAMSSLLKAGFISKHLTEKFTYEITSSGKSYLKTHEGPITPEDLKNVEGYEEAWDKARKANRGKSNTESIVSPSIINSTPTDLIESATQELNDELSSGILNHLLNTDPYHFEKIVIDVLVAMGYGGSREEAAQVTQKSNDGGIDGIINEDRLGLDVIYVQAKRYKNSVGRNEVQNFVGALAGKQAHKGIFITTSDYNRNAIEFAASVPQKVILINGERFADLMIEHNVGVSTEQVITVKKIDSDYFEVN